MRSVSASSTSFTKWTAPSPGPRVARVSVLPSPNRSSRCTVVVSGSSQRSARARPFKWSCLSVPSIGRGLPNQVTYSPIQQLQNLARISRRILRSALWVRLYEHPHVKSPPAPLFLFILPFLTLLLFDRAAGFLPPRPHIVAGRRAQMLSRLAASSAATTLWGASAFTAIEHDGKA